MKPARSKVQRQRRRAMTSRSSLRDVEVAVVIVNYNTRDLLRECLRSLRDSERGRDLRVIVVDNASSDGSIEMLRSEVPWIELIENRQNFGFAAANNQALMLTSEPFVLCLNPDTVVESNTIVDSVAFLRSHPRVGLLGCRLNDPDGTLQLSARRFPSVWTLIVEMTGLYKLAPRSWTLFQPWILRTDSVAETDIVKGAFFLMRREALEEVGRFDERFSLYSEEADWCRRVRSAGWKVVYYPMVHITHFEGASSRVGRNSTKFLLLESEMAYYRKHHGQLMAMFAIVLWLIGAVLRTFAWTLITLFRWLFRLGVNESVHRLRYYAFMVEWIACRPFRGMARLG